MRYLFTRPSCVFLGNRTFRGFTAGLLHPSTTLSNQVFRLFTWGGLSIPYLLCLTHFIFHFHLTLCDSIWTSSYSQAHIIQHPTQCQIGIIYTHPCNAVFCCAPMQCNCATALNSCPMYEDLYMDILHCTLCVCHEPSCLMHTTVHIFSLISI